MEGYERGITHTPGPWRATAIGTTFSIDARGANYLGIAFINPLGMHDKGIPSPMDKANATLIAAAPELKNMVHTLCDYLVEAHEPDKNTRGTNGLNHGGDGQAGCSYCQAISEARLLLRGSR